MATRDDEIPERMATGIDDELFDKVQPEKRCPDREPHKLHVWFRNGDLNDSWKCPGRKAKGQRPEDQPLPTPNTRMDVQTQVILDIKARRDLGRARYGTALQPFNGRDPDRDLYEELLDAVMYQKQRMLEQAASEEELAKIAHEYVCRELADPKDADRGHWTWEKLAGEQRELWIGLIRALRVAGGR